MTIFLNFSPTSNHLHPLQVVNCDSNSRLVVDEDDYGKFRLERVNVTRYGLMLVQGLRRWTKIKLTLDERLVFGWNAVLA